MLNNKESSVFSKVLIIVSLIIAIVSLYFFVVYKAPDKSRSQEQQQDVQIGGAFTLINQDGLSFKSEQLNGKPSLIYFGFTFCPDICPTALEKISVVVDVLNSYYTDVTPVFVTIDPLRDKPEVLKQYLSHFNKKFIGLTSDSEEITKKVADMFMVFYEKVPGSGTGRNDHLFDHSSLIYIMDKNGKYLGHIHMQSTADEMVEYIRNLIKQQKYYEKH